MYGFTTSKSFVASDIPVNIFIAFASISAEFTFDNIMYW